MAIKELVVSSGYGFGDSLARVVNLAIWAHEFCPAKDPAERDKNLAAIERLKDFHGTYVTGEWEGSIEECPGCGAIEGTNEWGTVGDGFDGYCPQCADKREAEGIYDEDDDDNPFHPESPEGRAWEAERAKRRVESHD